MDTRLEQQIRLDLEMALAQVRATIKADCHIHFIDIDGDSAWVVLGGDLNEAWYYAETVLVRPVLSRMVGFRDCKEINGVLYSEHPKGFSISVDQLWVNITERFVKEFFKANPEYRQAIGA